jgi:replicative DNA helicase Mcm
VVDVNDEDPFVERWYELFRALDLRMEIRGYESEYPDRTSLPMDYALIDRQDPDLGAELCADASVQLEAAGKAMSRFFQNPYAIPEPQLAVFNLPRDARVNTSQIRHIHKNRLVAVEGLVKKATAVQPLMTEARYYCPSCGYFTTIPQTSPGYHESPGECPKKPTGCGRGKLILDRSNCDYDDVQKAQLQDLPEGQKGQPTPQTVYLDGELAGQLQPGQKVIVNGIVSIALDDAQVKSNIARYVIHAISIERDAEAEDVITEEDEAEIRKLAQDPDLAARMVASVCPAIYGYEVEKEALALQAFGGVTKVLDDGTRLRGDIHVLLIGDPGVAKSLLLRHMAALAPKGIYVSGKASTAAGLTATATKDEWGEGRWTLEAGALVLADGGFSAVDEMDKMSDQDRSSMHEVMESQRVSIAKAGITATLNTRTPILGAANPKLGRFSPEQGIAEQIDMPSTLLSRFDLIFALRDAPNRARDEAIAKHILASHRRGEALAVADSRALAGTSEVRPSIEVSLLRKYIAYSKRIVPQMTDAAMDIIEAAYITLRSKSHDGALAITARQLEGYIRLSEASARSRLSTTVEKQDAERACRIIAHYLDGVTGGDIDMVEAEIPHGQREKLEAIRRIIRNAGEGISKDELEELSMEKGIKEHELETALGRLRERGEVFEAKGLLRAVKA